MEASKQTAILMDCIDQLADVALLSDTDKCELAQNIIDTLGNYPRPRQENEPTEPTPQCLGAYLYASTARNSVKLAQLGYMPFDNAFSVAGSCIEASLSLLTDKD
ncbi:hypothetical protein M2132_002491 [Dysgonomonas sp. PH5-45]|uniref:hypothetical protein n=1 Tax=unclassified Dysgonomonas TaxID=2630389 RepID=UPI00247727B5|nr:MULTISPECIES: hypothetical protein [unclassified Dysgonomonas]MDH6356128.1 hypothetical protein [Dysgonomonas sp. PH5-45]MDH6389022.1 hypothetical protein [Dysgonomonas sp. PH5-37]